LELETESTDLSQLNRSDLIADLIVDRRRNPSNAGELSMAVRNSLQPGTTAIARILMILAANREFPVRATSRKNETSRATESASYWPLLPRRLQ